LTDSNSAKLMMELKQRIAAFVQLGVLLRYFAENAPWPGYTCGINEKEYVQFNEVIPDLHYRNPWFTEQNIRKSLSAWHKNLQENELHQWLSSYPAEMLELNRPKKVGLVLAGNIPLVGMHDVLSVLITGHTAVIKFSSDDNLLLPVLLRFLFTFEPEFEKHVLITEGKLTDIEAVIATGSNNTSRYFDYYFSKYPHIIRKNRTSLAIVSHDTDEESLRKIGNDIFDFFGLGCRNVTHVLFPKDYDLNRFFKAIYDFNPIVNHNKYANNYDYYKALFMLNREDLLDNGFLLLRKHAALSSVLGTLHYQFYNGKESVLHLLETQKEEIQCVVNDAGWPENAVLPGETQNPRLWEYADGVDTIAFLLSLKN
jgi:hypothetical protein